MNENFSTVGFSFHVLRLLKSTKDYNNLHRTHSISHSLNHKIMTIAHVHKPLFILLILLNLLKFLFLHMKHMLPLKLLNLIFGTILEKKKIQLFLSKLVWCKKF